MFRSNSETCLGIKKFVRPVPACMHACERGCIKVDRWQRTNIEGVFAAGDCTCGGMQIVTAAGEGAMVAITALKYIGRKREQTES